MKSQNAFLFGSSLQVQPAGLGGGCGQSPLGHPHGSGHGLPWNAWTLGKRKDLTLGGLNAVSATSEPCLAYLG